MYLPAWHEELGALGSKGGTVPPALEGGRQAAGPVDPVYRKRMNIACLFRANSGAAGVADAVQTAGSPAPQPQSHGRAALPQHGGESWRHHTRERE